MDPITRYRAIWREFNESRNGAAARFVDLIQWLAKEHPQLVPMAGDIWDLRPTQEESTL